MNGIYTIIMLIVSNIFMTFAWYGHLKMKQQFSWFEHLPLIGIIAFSWMLAFLNIASKSRQTALDSREMVDLLA